MLMLSFGSNFFFGGGGLPVVTPYIQVHKTSQNPVRLFFRQNVTENERKVL